MTDISEPRYRREDSARRYFENLRWPDGKPVCPHCGAQRASRIRANLERKIRHGLWFCSGCRRQFTVTVGTMLERSRVPLHKWMLANHLMCASRKGVSAHQLHAILGITYKTARSMVHALRAARADQAVIFSEADGDGIDRVATCMPQPEVSPPEGGTVSVQEAADRA